MPQIARPAGDVAGHTGLWTPLPLFEKLDEAAPDDADAVTSRTDPQGTDDDTFIVSLGSLAWPQPGPHTLRVRLRKTAAGDMPVRVTLFQGDTEIEGWTIEPGTSFATSEFVISDQTRQRITDYTALRVRVRAGVPTVSGCTPCTVMPRDWEVKLAGVTGNCPNGNPCEPVANGSWGLTHQPGNTCSWQGVWGPCTGNAGAVQLFNSGTTWTLQFVAGNTSVVYTRTGINCLGSNVFTLVSANTCATWPQTLTLTPK